MYMRNLYHIKKSFIDANSFLILVLGSSQLPPAPRLPQLVGVRVRQHCQSAEHRSADTQGVGRRSHQQDPDRDRSGRPSRHAGVHPVCRILVHVRTEDVH